jgi:hypothetical protein
MSVSVEDIAAELEPETRAAVIDNMPLFNVRCFWLPQTKLNALTFLPFSIFTNA